MPEYLALFKTGLSSFEQELTFSLILNVITGLLNYSHAQ